MKSMTMIATFDSWRHRTSEMTYRGKRSESMRVWFLLKVLGFLGTTYTRKTTSSFT